MAIAKDKICCSHQLLLLQELVVLARGVVEALLVLRDLARDHAVDVLDLWTYN